MIGRSRGWMSGVLATANPDKAMEIRSILAEVGLEIELGPRPSEVPEVEEDGDTLEENARKKAEAVGRATGVIAIADDTGLFVDALGGAPGVRSARYAGEQASYEANCKKLLAELGETKNRRASFRTVAVARLMNGETVVATGSISGEIATSPRGNQGFGYDPLFIPDEANGLSFSEMDPKAKDKISHRGKAFRMLACQLLEVFR